MSPHGKRAGGQAPGQPRPPASTLRAPDRGGCARRRPRCPELRWRARPTGRARPPGCPGDPHPHFSSQTRRATGRSAWRPLPPLPPPEEGARVASPPAAALHNRGGGACPAAAGAGRFTWPGLRPQRRRRCARPGDRALGRRVPAGSATSPPARNLAALCAVRAQCGGLRGVARGTRGDCVRHRESSRSFGLHASLSPQLCARRCAGGRDTGDIQHGFCHEFRGTSGSLADWEIRGRQPGKIISGPLAGREKKRLFFFFLRFCGFVF